MFPTHGAQVYRNELGEVLGWDYPSYDEPDPDDFYNAYDDADREEHTHECRDCKATIYCEDQPCHWQGSNTGCTNCEEHKP